MLKNAIVAAALLGAGFAANALPVVTFANQSGPFINLNAPAEFTRLGGAIRSGSTGTYAEPRNDVLAISTVGVYLAAGMSNGGDALLTFTDPATSFVSFLWGSPDGNRGNTNTLTLTTNEDAYLYSPGAASLSGFVVAGERSVASYVGFTTSGTEVIQSLRFSSTSNAFEASNFSTTSPIPEPEKYALMLAGLGVVGFMARHRKAD